MMVSSIENLLANLSNKLIKAVTRPAQHVT